MASLTHPYVQANDLQQFPAALLSHTFSFLPPNERTLTARFVCRDHAAALSGPQHCTASLSQPLPPDAASWAVEAGQQHVRHLPFRHKLQLMSTAAASGSEVNLDVAWAILQPSIFPEILQDPCDSSLWRTVKADPAVTAIKRRHPQLLGWLLHRCPALVHPPDVLEAAAAHFDLAGLQAVWEQLQAFNFSSCSQDSFRCASLTGASVMEAAAGSTTPDAVAKMEWVLAKSGGRCKLHRCTAWAAARSGDLARLRWLRDHGCPMAAHRDTLLSDVLSGAAMSAVEWLVDEAGCSLLVPPEGQEEKRYWRWLVTAAASGTDGASRVLWLQRRGVPILQAFRFLLDTFRTMPITADEVQVVRMMQRTYGMGSEPGFPSDRDLTAGAAELGSIEVVEELRQAGLEFDERAYLMAGGRGNLPIIQWLAREAAVPADQVSLRELIEQWPGRTAAQSRSLLQAVQLLVGEAGCRNWDAGEVLFAAATRGDLGLVQYLLQQKPECVPDWVMLESAAKEGSETLLEWLAEQHPDMVGYGFESAVYHADKGALTTLRRMGVRWSIYCRVSLAVARGRRQPVLRWLVEQGAPVGSEEEWEGALRYRQRNDPGFDAAALRRLVANRAGPGRKA